jgi:D-serine deaminase-like pyridoxal phosphate-dependent protein
LVTSRKSLTSENPLLILKKKGEKGCRKDQIMNKLQLTIFKPTLLLDQSRALQNLATMTAKARNSGIRFRPHFKTHQSAQIGEWFREFGVDAITVSSVQMAMYFAQHGWKDITIAFPVNILEIDKINKLASSIQLNLLVESKETVTFLAKNLQAIVDVWIKIDIGYHRTGIPWDHFDEIAALNHQIKSSDKMAFRGLLTHSGHTYRSRSTADVTAIYHETVQRLQELKTRLIAKGFQGTQISIGDTPSCSIIEDFSGVDEIRPGNFVFYDIMQLNIGSCSEENIAVAVACPVVAKHNERKEIVIYGGAVHLSKEFIIDKIGNKVFGYIALLEENGWSSKVENTYASALSQEHGIIKTESDFFNQVKVGDILLILPAHSCLTVNLLRKYMTLDGEIMTTML